MSYTNVPLTPFYIVFLTNDESKHILNENHVGACGGHLSSMSTSQKIIRVDYFCPSLFRNYIMAIKHCRNCQMFSSKSWAPPTPFHPVMTAGPFYKWGINFMEFWPPSKNGHKYIIILVDNFTKWAKSMPTFTNTNATTAQFFFNNVIAYFGVPKQLVSNHGTQF